MPRYSRKRIDYALSMEAIERRNDYKKKLAEEVRRKFDTVINDINAIGGKFWEENDYDRFHIEK